MYFGWIYRMLKISIKERQGQTPADLRGDIRRGTWRSSNGRPRSSYSTTPASAWRCSCPSASPRAAPTPARCSGATPVLIAKLAVGGFGAGADRNAVGQDAHLPHAGISRHGVSARRAGDAGQPAAGKLSVPAMTRRSALGAAHQPARRGAVAARLRDAGAAARAHADQPLRRAGLRARLLDRDRGLGDRPGASVRLGRIDAAAQGRRSCRGSCTA